MINCFVSSRLSDILNSFLFNYVLKCIMIMQLIPHLFSATGIWYITNVNSLLLFLNMMKWAKSLNAHQRVSLVSASHM